MDAAVDRKKRREDNDADAGGTFSMKKISLLSKRFKEVIKSKEEQ